MWHVCWWWVQVMSAHLLHGHRHWLALDRGRRDGRVLCGFASEQYAIQSIRCCWLWCNLSICEIPDLVSLLCCNVQQDPYALYKVRHVHKLNWSLHVLAPGLLVQQLTCLDMQCVSMKYYYFLCPAWYSKEQPKQLAHWCTMTHCTTRQPKLLLKTAPMHGGIYWDAQLQLLCMCASKWSLLDSREQRPWVLFFILHVCKTALVCILYSCHLPSDRYL